MFPLWLSAENLFHKAPVSQPVADEDIGLPENEQPSTPAETDFGTVFHGKDGDLPGYLATIIANAEFLEVLYGENQYLKNILDAAGKAKRHFQDIHECLKKRSPG